MQFSTKAVHSGNTDDPAGAVVVPIYQVSTYRQKEPGAEGQYVYSRTGNPTRTALERSIATLEGAKYGSAFASGMAAITTTLVSLVKRGDHVVAGEDLYGGTRRLFDQILRNFGVEFSYVEGTTLNDFAAAMKPATKLVWVETPTNPSLRVVDIRGVADIAHGKGAAVAVDNTFMTPYLQRPLEHGADIGVHSTTKYLGGHADLLGGAAVTSNEKIHEKIRFAQNAMGAVPGPLDCWLVLRGMKTLHVRMERHSSNAQRLAEFLEKHPKIGKVSYPGLASHPQHQLAKKQMDGFGGMLSFHVKGDFEACKRLLKGVQVFTVAESLGGVESLIEHPASMTHASVPKPERERIGITDSVIRLSVGIEDVDDLISDLSRGLENV